jgi:hypothetical protein
MKQQHMINALALLFLALITLTAAPSYSAVPSTMPAAADNSLQPGPVIRQKNPEAEVTAASLTAFDADAWIYADPLLAGVDNIGIGAALDSPTNPAQPAAPATTPLAAADSPALQRIGLQWTDQAEMATPISAVSTQSAGGFRFSLIPLDRADIDGNNGALLFAILSAISVGVCLRMKKTPPSA